MNFQEALKELERAQLAIIDAQDRVEATRKQLSDAERVLKRHRDNLAKAVEVIMADGEVSMAMSIIKSIGKAAEVVPERTGPGWNPPVDADPARRTS